MGNSTKPRKAYKPLRQRMPIVYGIDSEIRTEMAVAPLIAINMFTSGHGSEEHAYTIINSILLGCNLAYKLEKSEEIQILYAGSDAMRRVLDRGAEGKWGFSGDDLKDITAAVALSDELQAGATRRELREAVEAVFASAHKSEAKKS
jgi:hypothetical protein